MNAGGSQGQPKARNDKSATAGGTERPGGSAVPGASKKQQPTKLKRLMQVVLQRITEGNDKEEPRQERGNIPDIAGQPSSATDRPSEPASISTKGHLATVVSKVFRLKYQARREEQAESTEMLEKPTVSHKRKEEHLAEAEGNEGSVDSRKRRTGTVPMKDRRQSTGTECLKELEQQTASNEVPENPTVSHTRKKWRSTAQAVAKSVESVDQERRTATYTQVPTKDRRQFTKAEGHTVREQRPASNEMLEKPAVSHKPKEEELLTQAVLKNEGSANQRKRTGADSQVPSNDRRQSTETEGVLKSAQWAASNGKLEKLTESNKRKKRQSAAQAVAKNEGSACQRKRTGTATHATTKDRRHSTKAEGVLECAHQAASNRMLEKPKVFHRSKKEKLAEAVENDGSVDSRKPRLDRENIPATAGQPSTATDGPSEPATKSTKRHFAAVVKKMLRLKTPTEPEQQGASTEMLKNPRLSFKSKTEQLAETAGKDGSIDSAGKRRVTDTPVATQVRRQTTKSKTEGHSKQWPPK
ncbi:trichohyalin-like [Lineus longissimus]|uniref:trichohyalin-like n=1 Tax=Lineus longissimus TaxID=88925 RepID=UPI00315CDE6D